MLCLFAFSLLFLSNSPLLLISAHSPVLPKYQCFPIDVFQLSPTPHCQVPSMLSAPTCLTSPSSFLGLSQFCFPSLLILQLLVALQAPWAPFVLDPEKAAEALNALSPLPVSDVWLRWYLQAFHPTASITQFSKQVHVSRWNSAIAHALLLSKMQVNLRN